MGKQDIKAKGEQYHRTHAAFNYEEQLLEGMVGRIRLCFQQRQSTAAQICTPERKHALTESAPLLSTPPISLSLYGWPA